MALQGTFAEPKWFFYDIEKLAHPYTEISFSSIFCHLVPPLPPSREHLRIPKECTVLQVHKVCGRASLSPRPPSLSCFQLKVSAAWSNGEKRSSSSEQLNSVRPLITVKAT